jgi:predicted amino acid dehydrogenase
MQPAINPGVNKFAFIIHPLNLQFIRQDPRYRWTRFMPDGLLEWLGALWPPVYLSSIRGGQSPATGQRIEGLLYTLGATPRAMMRHKPRFTYNRIKMAAHMAEKRGARIIGLGAFTSVVGDAGITLARELEIGVTSGNSLTAAVALESLKSAASQMGIRHLSQAKAMVIGATGSIGSVCSRLLAEAGTEIVLVSLDLGRLSGLKDRIQAETPQARLAVATKTEGLVEACDLIVSATSAFGQRVLDIVECKPGAVICDVANPPDINPAEAKLRPDVLVIEPGDVLIPGDVHLGYDIGLPPNVVYACLAETALLAMEGRFEDYTVGRDISTGRVQEIYDLFRKHQFQLTGLRSFGKEITADEIIQKRQLADQLLRDESLLARTRQTAADALAKMQPTAKGVVAARNQKTG